jgi:hypothetical protein
MTWTQPICEDCWVERSPGTPPVRVIFDAEARCCFCGSETWSGIYVRVNPASVPYPSEDE